MAPEVTLKVASRGPNLAWIHSLALLPQRTSRLKGLIFRTPRTNRDFVTPYGWKVARLFSRLGARVFRPAVAMFTGNDAVLPFPLRASLDRVDTQMDELIYQAFPQIRAA